MYKDFEEIQNKTLKEIKKSYKTHKLIPFVGAGFSLNIPGYPDWWDFLINLSVEEKIPFYNIFEDPLEAAEFYIWRKARGERKNFKKEIYRKEIYHEGKRNLINKIKTELMHLDRIRYNEGDWEQHKILVENFSVIYTTNWDLTFETVIKELSIPGIKFFSDSEYIYSKDISFEDTSFPKKVQIIKFHGECFDIEEKIAIDSIIATESDLLLRMEKEYPIDQFFKNDFIRGSDFLFIGYSFSELNTRRLLYQLISLIENTSLKYRQTGKFFWFTLDNPSKFNQLKIEFLKEWKKIYPYFLFINEQQKYKKWFQLNININQLRKNLGEIIDRLHQSNKKEEIREEIEKIREKIKNKRNEQLAIIRPLIREKLKEIINS